MGIVSPYIHIWNNYVVCLKLNIMLYVNCISIKNNKYIKNKCWHIQGKKKKITPPPPLHQMASILFGPSFSINAAHFYCLPLKPQTGTTAAPWWFLEQEARPGKHLPAKSGPARSCTQITCDAQAFLQTRASLISHLWNHLQSFGEAWHLDEWHQNFWRRCAAGEEPCSRNIESGSSSS